MSATLENSQLFKRLAWSADELAESIGVSRKTIFNHTEPRGSLKATRIGSAVRYRSEDVARWLAELQAS